MIVLRYFLLSTILALYACGTSMNVPVEDIGQASQYKQMKVSDGISHKVEKGDTLFSIALRYDLDYKKLAAQNNIYPPYIIKPNDMIYLKGAPRSTGSYGSNVRAAHLANNPIVDESIKNTGVIERNGVKQKNTPALQVVKKKELGVKVPANTNVLLKPVSVMPVENTWIWPVTGKVVRQFSPQDLLSKGIDISADMATPVLSSRSGEVVYAGSSLKGYGNLIIIRHDDTYISAYAHNRTILVKEGQAVKQGEKVAEVGMSGTQFPKLHFEIREHGKPINPIKLLPVKQ